MADFDRIRDYLRAHRDDLAGEVAAGFTYEFDNLARQWAAEGDTARALELTREVLGRHQEVRDALAAEGLWPEEWQDEPLPAAVRPQARVPAAARAEVAAPPLVSQPTGEREMAKPTNASSPTDRLALWDKGLTIGKEAVTGCLGFLIVAVTLIMALVAMFTVGADPQWTRAKDLLLILNGLVGVVLGYYFGRIPGEARADKAEGEAKVARSELDGTKAEVRGLLSGSEVAETRGMSDAELQLSPEKARRLWEIVNR